MENANFISHHTFLSMANTSKASIFLYKCKVVYLM